MYDKYEIVGGVFNLTIENINFAKEIGLKTNRIYKDFDEFIDKESSLPQKDRIEVVSVLTQIFYIIQCLKNF